MNLKGYKPPTTAKRRLLAVVGDDQVLTNPKGGKDEKKGLASSKCASGRNGINWVLNALSVANRAR